MNSGGRDPCDLSIVIVTFNAGDVLKPCLRSVYAQTQDIRFEVLLVDNASTDGTLEMVWAEFPQATRIANNRNIGFAAASNIGIRRARGRFVLLLNPDTEIVAGALQAMVAFMERHPAAGVVGCKLVFPDGTLQPSARSFPTIMNVLSESMFLYRIFPRSPIFGRYYLSYFDHDVERRVDWVSGACMLTRREALVRVGTLDERFFMYCEDMDFCQRAGQAGLEVWFFPGAEVIHHWAGQTAVTRQTVARALRSEMLYFHKHCRSGYRQVIVAVKYLGVVGRVGAYLVAGVLLLRRQLLAKSYYALYALYCLHRPETPASLATER